MLESSLIRPVVARILPSTPRALGGLESVIVIGNGAEIQRRSLSPVPAEETELSKTFPTAALATLALVDGRREPKGRPGDVMVGGAA